MWPDTEVRAIMPPVDLEAWSPDGPNGYNFHGMGGYPNIVCTDAWRYDIDPFPVVIAFALFTRKFPHAKLHFYGNSKEMRAWAPLMKAIQDRGNLGEVAGWVAGLDNVYRAADLLITPHRIYVRSIREAWACDCRATTAMHADPEQPEHFAEEMERMVGYPKHDGMSRKLAEKLFDPKKSAAQFLGLLPTVVRRAA
jgi:hypothetical protein